MKTIPSNSLIRLMCLVLTVAVLGCGKSNTPDIPPTAPTPVGRTAVGESAPTETSVTTTSDGSPLSPGDNADERPSSSNGEQSAAAGEASGEPSFTPPYPDRRDLFAPPKLAGLENLARNADRSRGPLELKGFVQVDVPRAVMLIDGDLAQLAEGEEHNGVQIVSIAPPSVTLQRGRERWTESLLPTGVERK